MEGIQEVKNPLFKQPRNEQTLKIYASFLCGLMIVVVVARWLQRISDRTPLPEKSHRRRDAWLQASRNLEISSGWTILGRPSWNLILLTSIFLMVNITLATTNHALIQINHYASRFGWLAAANMALCTFFGLKNTPFGYAARASHAQLNILHRIVGYAAVFLIVLHAILYTIRLARQDNLSKLLETSDLAGIGAGTCMVILFLGYFRHRGYEIFYLSHIGGFIGTLFLAYIHRPNFAKKLPYVLMFAGSIWAVDRIIRAVWLLLNSINNSATLHPLPDGGARIILKKSGGARPGSHCYLWVPRAQLFGLHPFTIVDSGPSGLELVMKARDGFTRAVFDLALQHPGKTVWASIDGPYGSLPEVENYDKMVLIAGGSGAAFTFGLMNRILSQDQKHPPIDFVWAVRHKEHLAWFQEHLKSLTAAGSGINVILYITGEDVEAGSKISGRQSEDWTSEESVLLSKGAPRSYQTISQVDDESSLLSDDADVDSNWTDDLRFTKLDTQELLSETLQDVAMSQRVFVASCGPQSMMNSIKDATDEYVRLGYKIDAHSEDFGGS